MGKKPLMKNLLIVDVETTGVDRANDRVIELGCVLWSVAHRTSIEVYSRLLDAPENPAEAVNGIPSALIAALKPEPVFDALIGLAFEADAIVAHQADFDRAFCMRGLDGIPERDWPMAIAQPWICTREDMKWPKGGTGESLIALALAHGVAVVSAHRAISDCLLLARLFEQCFATYPDFGERLEAALEHSRLPKVRLVSLAPFEEKDTVKAAGFKWDPHRKEWWRVMAQEDAKDLPFRTRVALEDERCGGW